MVRLIDYRYKTKRHAEYDAWRFFFIQTVSGQHPTIYVQDLSGDISRQLGSQEDHGVSHIVGCAAALERNGFRAIA